MSSTIILKELGRVLGSDPYRTQRSLYVLIHPATRIAFERLRERSPLRIVDFDAYGRCSICTRSKDRKIKQKCNFCQKKVCKEHCNVVCNTCFNQ